MIISDLKIGAAYRKGEGKSDSIPSTIDVNMITNIGVILDHEADASKDSFLKWQEELGIPDRDFTILTCKDKRLKTDVFEGLVFTMQDLGWNGKIKNGEVEEFLKRPFDVLVSFTEHDNKLAALLVSLSHARLKVGRNTEKYSDMFDLMISTDADEAAIFLKELKKYLHILNQTA